MFPGHGVSGGGLGLGLRLFWRGAAGRAGLAWPVWRVLLEDLEGGALS